MDQNVEISYSVKIYFSLLIILMFLAFEKRLYFYLNELFSYT